MPSSLQDITSFERIFTGNLQSYGIHLYGISSDGEKEVGGENFTKVEPVHTDLYSAHLNGKKGLGIVPITIANKCSFSVIDVDVYDGSIAFLIDMLYRYNFPLFPFKSKSGGLHLYSFYKEPIVAKKVISYCQTFIAMLGLNKNTEIFPKQFSLKPGQAGNWINLPYYNKDEAKTYMIGRDKKPLSFIEAMMVIDESMIDSSDLNAFLENLPLNDGPPCLQSIYLKGSTTNRNEYLFSMARYLKTKHGDDFEFKLTEMNNNLDSPISVKELMNTVISTHKKKDYSYRCTQDPILSLCHKDICKTREFGIGGEEISDLSFEEFTQFTTDPPYYEWKINSNPLIFFSEQDIISQGKFRELCMRQIHVLPMRLKDKTWTTIVNSALNNVIIKEVSHEEDISPGGMFVEHLNDFLENRSPAENKEQILVDRVFKDEEMESYVFKPKNFISFLFSQKQFREFRATEIQDRLRKLGGKPIRYYVNNKYKTTRVWILPWTAMDMFQDLNEEKNIEIDFMEDMVDEDF